MSAIKTERLTKFYGKSRGVRNINLEVEEGEIFGFIGPNGSGKSTTIRIIMQLIHPTSGKLEVLNRRITGDKPKLRREIGYLPSEINLYKELTGKQILEFTATFQLVPCVCVEGYHSSSKFSMVGYSHYLGYIRSRTAACAESIEASGFVIGR